MERARSIYWIPGGWAAELVWIFQRSGKPLVLPGMDSCCIYFMWMSKRYVYIVKYQAGVKWNRNILTFSVHKMEKDIFKWKEFLYIFVFTICDNSFFQTTLFPVAAKSSDVPKYWIFVTQKQMTLIHIAWKCYCNLQFEMQSSFSYIRHVHIQPVWECSHVQALQQLSAITTGNYTGGPLTYKPVYCICKNFLGHMLETILQLPAKCHVIKLRGFLKDPKMWKLYKSRL